MLTPQDPR